MEALKNKTIVIFLDEDWDHKPLGYTRKRMLLALAKYLNRFDVKVLCIERPICPLTTTLQNRRKLWEWLRYKAKLRPLTENMFLYTPGMFLHERLAPYVPGVVFLNSSILRRQVLNCLKRLGWQKRKRLVLIFHPYQRDMLNVLPDAIVVYECYDEYAPKSWRTRLVNPSYSARARIHKNEVAILRRADVVITTASELHKKCSRVNPHTHLLHNGVDYERFALDNLEKPTDLGELPRPLIGFAGMSKGIVDFKLIVDCAQLRPNWTFVFLGPEDKASSFQQWAPFMAAKRQPNIVFWGVKPELDVPKYMNEFDVCIIPYTTNSDCTAAIYPLKINEYLALKKPVVTTNYLQDFAEYQDVIIIADDTPVAFCAAIEASLTPDPSKLELGRDIAQKNSWNRRAEKFIAFIVSYLEEKRVGY